MVECRTPEREVRGSRPTAAVLCPWARHFTPRKYWLITQEAMAPSRYDWKIVDWDVKPQHNQPTKLVLLIQISIYSNDAVYPINLPLLSKDKYEILPVSMNKNTQLTSLRCYNVVLTLRFGHENVVNNVVSMFSRNVFLMCTQRCQTTFHITFSQPSCNIFWKY